MSIIFLIYPVAWFIRMICLPKSPYSPLPLTRNFLTDSMISALNTVLKHDLKLYADLWKSPCKSTRKRPNLKSNPMLTPDFTDSIVNEILNDLTLREKHEIAMMDLDDMDILEEVLSLYLEAHGVSTAGQSVINKVWKRLHETHQLRVVK